MPRKRKVAEGGFRLNRKEVGLTYSCPRTTDECRALSPELKQEGAHAPECKCVQPILTHDELLAFLRSKGSEPDYIIGMETHKTGAIHWHAYVKYCAPIETSSSLYFDFKTVHPNILNGKPGIGWKNYCCKEKHYETNFYQQGAFQLALAESNKQAALELLWKREPKAMCISGHLIEANLAKRFRIEHVAKRYFGPYPEAYYPVNWDPTSMSLLIVGQRGICKTQFARYLLGDHDYIKGEYEAGLKQCNFQRPILFDEISMLDMHPEQSKEITDVEAGGTVKCRYGDVVIPPAVQRIFLHNIEYPFKNPKCAVYGRRVQTLNLMHIEPPAKFTSVPGPP